MYGSPGHLASSTPHALYTLPIIIRPPSHQLLQSQILPSTLFGLLCRSLYSKRRMLIRHNIILVFRIQWLVLRRYVDFIVWKFVFAEVFEEVGMAGGGKVDVGV